MTDLLDLLPPEFPLPPSTFHGVDQAAKDNVIVQVGARPSTTGSRRGGLVRVWIGVAA